MIRVTAIALLVFALFAMPQQQPGADLILHNGVIYTVDQKNPTGIRVGAGDEWIRLGALKGHIDGIMGTSSARFFKSYSNNPNNRGRWRPLMVNETPRTQTSKRRSKDRSRLEN